MNKRVLKSWLGIPLLLLAAFSISAAAQAPKKVLVVTVTKGFRHSSIPTAETVLGKLAEKSGVFTVDFARTDEDLAAKLTPEAIKGYDGFIFANTTGVLPVPDKQALLDAIKGGKGFVGMHSASDTFHAKDPSQVDPYIEMLGGEFLTHGAQVGVECLNHDRSHPATKHFGESYCIEMEEIYLFKNYDASRVHELLTLDKHPNQKKKAGSFPVAWCRKHGEGNVFYTSLGHREDVWENERYQKHILGGIKWALGLEPGDATPQKTALDVAAAEGFRPLFNGKDLTGWKLRRADGHPSWTVKDGVLVNTVNQGEHGTDLVTEEKFWNFTARYEYRIPPGSNSGFYLRGRHEIQILDDYEVGKPTPGGNGAIYQHMPVSKFVSKKPGEWQKAEATMIGNKVTVILNGVKVHDNVEVNRATGSEIDTNVTEPGPIFLQGDHGTISFRNMVIKVLE
jgi:type 1 glutamine amidotransferase